MSERVIVFRVSRWFLEKINEYCKTEGISYAELFERAIEHLCKKYLEEENVKSKNSRGADRDSCQGANVSEAPEDSPNARADEV